jgi:hypothetical protein
MDEDDALRRAIALSLAGEKAKGGRRAEQVVDLTEDDEVWPGFKDADEMDYYKAIAISMDEGTATMRR